MRNSRATKRCSFVMLNAWLGTLRGTQKLTQALLAQLAQDGAACPSKFSWRVLGFFKSDPKSGKEKGDAAEAANVPLFPACLLPPKGCGG